MEEFQKNIDTSFDDYFMSLESLEIKYHPWIGKNFASSNHKILIIGESVYNWGTTESEINEVNIILQNNNFARIVAYEHGIKKMIASGRFAKNIEKVLTGKEYSTEEESIEFWESIAFHEFVQRPMENINERPSKEDYKIGSKILLELIEKLQINKCIFLGTTWDKYASIVENLETKRTIDFTEKLNNTYPKIVELQNSLSTKIYFIKHPSRFFSWALWFDFINKN